MKRFSLLPLLVLAPLAAVTLPAQQFRGRDYRSRIDTTFAFDKRGTVSLTATNGDIVVTGWSRDQIHVRAISENGNIRFDASSSRMSGVESVRASHVPSGPGRMSCGKSCTRGCGSPRL